MSDIRELTQDDIDALWLACRVVFPADRRRLHASAQLRLQRLCSAGVIEHAPGVEPTLIPPTQGERP